MYNLYTHLYEPIQHIQHTVDDWLASQLVTADSVAQLYNYFQLGQSAPQQPLTPEIPGSPSQDSPISNFAIGAGLHNYRMSLSRSSSAPLRPSAYPRGCLRPSDQDSWEHNPPYTIDEAHWVFVNVAWTMPRSL